MKKLRKVLSIMFLAVILLSVIIIIMGVIIHEQRPRLSEMVIIIGAICMLLGGVFYREVKKLTDED